MNVIAYEWRLREVMAGAGIFSTTKLGPLLKERGIDLSVSQVYRLAAEKPERLNLHVLVALLDILNCTADDLIRRVDIGLAAPALTGTDDRQADTGSAALRKSGLRPRRAEVTGHDA